MKIEKAVERRVGEDFKGAAGRYGLDGGEISLEKGGRGHKRVDGKN